MTSSREPCGPWGSGVSFGMSIVIRLPLVRAIGSDAKILNGRLAGALSTYDDCSRFILSTDRTPRRPRYTTPFGELRSLMSGSRRLLTCQIQANGEIRRPLGSTLNPRQSRRGEVLAAAQEHETSTLLPYPPLVRARHAVRRL